MAHASGLLLGRPDTEFDPEADHALYFGGDLVLHRRVVRRAGLPVAGPTNLEPAELRHLALAAVAPYADRAILARQVTREEEQRRTLAAFLDGRDAAGGWASAGYRDGLACRCGGLWRRAPVPWCVAVPGSHRSRWLPGPVSQEVHIAYACAVPSSIYTVQLFGVDADGALVFTASALTPLPRWTGRESYPPPTSWVPWGQVAVTAVARPDQAEVTTVGALRRRLPPTAPRNQSPARP